MEATQKEAIGKRIKHLRVAAGETQQQLGEKVNVVQQSVAAWEGGRCLPDIPSLIEIAKHYNVTTDQLLGLSGELLQYPVKSLRDGLSDAMTASLLPDDLRQGIIALIRLERAGLLDRAS